MKKERERDSVCKRSDCYVVHTTKKRNGCFWLLRCCYYETVGSERNSYGFLHFGGWYRVKKRGNSRINSSKRNEKKTDEEGKEVEEDNNNKKKNSLIYTLLFCFSVCARC